MLELGKSYNEMRIKHKQLETNFLPPPATPGLVPPPPPPKIPPPPPPPYSLPFPPFHGNPFSPTHLEFNTDPQSPVLVSHCRHGKFKVNDNGDAII